MPRRTTQIDDRPEERESPVRHAHAVAANRHGRASAPGYLGLPANDAPEHDLTAAESEESGDSEETEDEQEQPRRSPRVRARATSTSRNDTGEGGDPRSNGKDKRSQDRGPRNSPKRRAKGSSTKAGSASAAASKSRKGGARGQAKKGASKGRVTSNGRGTSKGGGTSKSAGRRGAQAAAASVKSKAAKTALSAEHELRKGAMRGALHIAGALARRAAIAASRRAGQAMTRAGARGIDGVIERAHRLPIQQSIDVAVPPEIAWEQWMEFEHLPEGTHRLVDVERDGDRLAGTIDGPRSRSWSAEVIDERDQESFAWRSLDGSDSAGLVTFHPLSERLTRLEVTIDVLPESLGEAARLMLHLADRRIEEELRRFKADVELLNPDVYEELLASADDGGSDGEESG